MTYTKHLWSFETIASVTSLRFSKQDNIVVVIHNSWTHNFVSSYLNTRQDTYKPLCVYLRIQIDLIIMFVDKFYMEVSNYVYWIVLTFVVSDLSKGM